MSGSFGDKVRYDLRDSHGGGPEEMFVIGEAHYSDNGDVLVVTDEPYIGMPIHSSHCTVISSGHEEKCLAWRERYLSKGYPLKPRPNPTPSPPPAEGMEERE